MGERHFTGKIIEWYLQNKRALPWRDTRDPYKIWLSEIILQQTRVNQGLPYYLRFVEKYADVKSLAKAPQDEVMRLWQGLGYYSRARNLQSCAKEIVATHQGIFPSTFLQLKELPGIGEYTAAAIASFAFHQPVAVVDGNVFRVLSRVYGIDTPINSPAGKKQFSEIANQLIDPARPDIFNQAIMEFGAMHCTPVNPRCGDCPLTRQCVAYSSASQTSYPVKLQKTRQRKRYFYYLVYHKSNSLLMKKRVDKDIWLGLYDFPLIESSKPLGLKKLVSSNSWTALDLPPIEKVKSIGSYKHVLTHQVIHSEFLIINQRKKVKFESGNAAFYSFSQISKLPKPILINRFLTDFAFHL